jgi:RNA polymerase sigma-70 factor (ECF subfamily)
MSRQQDLSEAFERARPRLIRVGYAVLGSRHEAEDVVSETWLRLVTADANEPIRDVEAWATVAVARAALDTLRSARSRREVYVGPWLPEPLISFDAAVDPADRVTLDETVSYALLVVLESLTPAERTSWVLHDVFGMPFTEIAGVVGRSHQAVRQLAARARVHLESQQPRLDVASTEHDQAVTAFLAAAAGGDLQALLAVLDPDVVCTSDGGGQVSAARRPVLGADRVARFVLGIGAMVWPEDTVEIITVNGAAGIGVRRGDAMTTVVSLTVVAGLITRVDVIRAPDKLMPSS